MDRKADFNVIHERPLRTYPDGVYYSDILSPNTIWKTDGLKVVNACSVNFGNGGEFVSSEEYPKMTSELLWDKRNTIEIYITSYEFSKDFIYLGTKKTMESILIDKTTGHSKLGHFHLSTTSQPRIIGKAFFSNLSNKIQFVFDWQENICTHK